ncbi:MAG TPA: hypothetical protein VJ831_10565, partial [Jatrophihabitantaceae bacterium]|nr:hypothetical protein [Jatrophihabitantaceae bacterium]
MGQSALIPQIGKVDVVLLGGVLLMLGAAGAGTLLGWQNRDAVVRVHIGDVVWTGRLWAVLAVGALLACWFL